MIRRFSSTWSKSRLGDYLRIKHGYAFKGEFFASTGPFVLLTPGNFKAEGGLQSRGNREKYYDGPVPEEFILCRGDLLVVMTDLTQNAPILGSSAIISEDGRFLHNQRLGKVVDIDDERIDRLFLYYLFNLPHVRGQIKATATGATVRHTAPDRIYAVEVYLPPVAVQQRIAEILQALDTAIQNNTHRIAILEEMAQVIYREWFVNFRFPGHAQGELVESELGPIPEGWTWEKLGAVCHLTMGQSPKSEFYNEEGRGLPFHQGVSDFGDRCPTTRVYCTVDQRVAEPGDILFSVRAPVGRINIANQRIVIGRGLHAIRHNENQQEFLYYQLKDRFREEDTMGGGTIFKSVTKQDMLGINFLVPPATLTAKFEEVMSPISNQIANLTRQQVVLQETRDLLLPKLISGEIDVSELPEPESAVA
jgi:type I restriction enzyme, S subunit